MFHDVLARVTYTSATQNWLMILNTVLSGFYCLSIIELESLKQHNQPRNLGENFIKHIKPPILVEIFCQQMGDIFSNMSLLACILFCDIKIVNFVNFGGFLPLWLGHLWKSIFSHIHKLHSGFLNNLNKFWFQKLRRTPCRPAQCIVHVAQCVMAVREGCPKQAP